MITQTFKVQQLTLCVSFYKLHSLQLWAQLSQQFRCNSSSLELIAHHSMLLCIHLLTSA